MYAFVYQKSVNKRLPLKEVDVRKEIQDLVITKEMVLQHLELSKLTFIESDPESRIPTNPLPSSQGNTLHEAIFNLTNQTPNPVSLKQEPKTNVKREFIAKTVWTYAPEWLKTCLVYNIMKCNLSKVCY